MKRFDFTQLLSTKHAVLTLGFFVALSQSAAGDGMMYSGGNCRGVNYAAEEAIHRGTASGQLHAAGATINESGASTNVICPILGQRKGGQYRGVKGNVYVYDDSTSDSVDCTMKVSYSPGYAPTELQNLMLDSQTKQSQNGAQSLAFDLTTPQTYSFALYYHYQCELPDDSSITSYFVYENVP
jgi:hypothetical protein